MDYTVSITTIPGVADSAVLDRLAERVYGTKELADALLALEEDGSITASFCVTDPFAAAQRAVTLFLAALVGAEPRRAPNVLEEEHGAHEVAGLGALDAFSVASSGDRELVVA
jgi:hypothetical protein